jgi:glycosyltransferase involved in cell wall biosynthesis
MKIGICTFGCDGGKSGISRYTIELIREFAASGSEHQFEIIAHEDEQHIFAPPAEQSANFKMLLYPAELRATTKNILWHQTTLPGLCKERGFDVLFLPAGNRRLPYKCPCPTVGTVHDFSSLHVEGKYSLSHMIYIKKILPALCRRLTRTITVSECSKHDIVHYAHVPQEKVDVIYSAADKSVYKLYDAKASRKLALEKYGIDKPYILYASRIEHPGKNHVALIRAFAALRSKGKLADRDLVFVGSDWSGAEAVHVEAQNSVCADAIKFLGFVPGADLPYLYSAAETFVFPSLYEGFGLPILEAMQCGVPVACSNRSALPEVAGDAALLFDAGNDDSVAAALERMTNDTRFRNSCIQKGLVRAAGFSWSISAQQTMHSLELAAAGKNAPAHSGSSSSVSVF